MSSECYTCPKGFYCPPGTHAPLPCQAGEVCNIFGLAAPSKCPAQQYFNGNKCVDIKRTSTSGFSDFGDSIPSWFVCDWFFAIFIINVVVLLILLFVMMKVNKKGMKGLMQGNMPLYVLSGVFAATNTLFYYLVCDRSLNK